jgi:hypothetical protein
MKQKKRTKIDVKDGGKFEDIHTLHCPPVRKEKKVKKKKWLTKPFLDIARL